MNETKFDWDDLRLFLCVGRLGGLAAAAKATGKSPPTLGRRMLALEKRLGTELFIRQARAYELTESGRQLLVEATKLEDDISPILSAANAAGRRRVKISAGTWVSYFLSQHVSELLQDESFTVQFISADHLLDISHREAVIGIRNQRPSQVSLAGRRTGKVQFAVYAVNKRIKTWACVIGSTPSAQWVRERVQKDSFVEVSHPRNALDISKAGGAKMVLPTFVGDTTEGLIRVSKTIDELEHMQWLVVHQEERHTPEVRTVIDWVHEKLADTLCNQTP